MARIIVTPDDQDLVLFEEHVYPVHLANELSSRQVAERLSWAVGDAEASERRAKLAERFLNEPLAV